MAVKKSSSRRVSGKESDAKAPVRGGVVCERSAAQVKRDRAGKQSLAQRIIALVEVARQKVATVANLAQVYTNYEIGRQIVEEEQGGQMNFNRQPQMKGLRQQ